MAGRNVLPGPLGTDGLALYTEQFPARYRSGAFITFHAKQRPSGLAVGPDGALYVSDDVHGRIYRIVYAPASGAAAGDAQSEVTPCPAADAPAGLLAALNAKPPEGIDPNAGSAIAVKSGSGLRRLSRLRW